MNLLERYPIASILRKCDNDSSSSNINPSHAFPGRVRHPFIRAALQRLAEIRAKSRYRLWRNMGHWDSDHNRDGLLKPGVNFYKNKPKGASSKRRNQDMSPTNKTCKFQPVSIWLNSLLQSQTIGALLDDRAPYSGFGIQ